MGIKITSNFERNASGDTYSLMDILTVKGGFSSFANMATLNSGLPLPVRTDNMVVYTADNQSFYELTTNPSTDVTTPSDWTILTVGVSGGVTIKGTAWDASANTGPVLNDNSGTAGDFHICGTAGTVNDANIAAANGETFVVGDWIIFDGTNWRRLAQSGNAGDWNTLANKPATYPPDVHTHTIADLDAAAQALINGKEDLTNKVQTLTDVNANKTSTSMYPSLNALVDYIAQEITAAGTGGGGTTDHNLLTTLQGGDTNEYYHFDASQHSKLLALIYTAPTIRFNGSTALKLASTVETGNNITVSTTITPTFTELANITPATTWEKKETQAGSFGATSTTAPTFTSAYSGVPGNGITKVSEGRIYEVTSSGSGNVLVSPTVYTYVQTMYRVYYFMADSATDFTDPGNTAALQNFLNTTKGNSNVPNQVYHELRSAKKTGKVTFTEPGTSPVHIYTVHPDSYGTQVFDNATFPGNNYTTVSSTFSYNNNGTATTYRITRLSGTSAPLAINGSIEINFK